MFNVVADIANISLNCVVKIDVKQNSSLKMFDKYEQSTYLNARPKK